MSEKSFHDPPETVILEEGVEVQQTKAYGVGIDTHSKFIQVSVYVKRDMRFFEYRHEFSTRWNDLVLAKQWILNVVRTCSNPVPDLTESLFHYCIESTSTYHFPILLAWEGNPSIVNPTIAGSTKRKTDVLDAKLLALHDLTGVWPSSYLPSRDVWELRVLISERNRYVHEATAASNRINNVIVQFGLTMNLRNYSAAGGRDIRYFAAQFADMVIKGTCWNVILQAPCFVIDAAGTCLLDQVKPLLFSRTELHRIPPILERITTGLESLSHAGD